MPNTETAGAGAKPERTPQDYAIEHAEYMAQDAERLLDTINHLNAQRDEDGDAFDSDALARAEEAVTEAFSSVRNGIYEFRKRRNRATAQPAEAQQPGAAYAALPDEREAFEAMMRSQTFDSLKRLSDGSYESYEARVGWLAWNVRASHGQAPAQAAPAAVAGSSEFPHEKMDAVALGRYKVVSSDQSMFYRFAVVAGDGAQQLYIGREVDCQNMARKFAGAFLDGAFAYHSMTAAPTTQPTPAAQGDALTQAARDVLARKDQLNGAAQAAQGAQA